MKTPKAELRLDNAANIYPASLTKHYASLFRLHMVFVEDIDIEIMNRALENVSWRIPTFRCRLKAGAFWWYLKPVDFVPKVHKLSGLKVFDFIKFGGLLYKVMVDGKGLYMDVFHALTDGGGGLTFFLTMAAEYCRLKYGSEVPYGGFILDPRDAPRKEELEDGFKTVFGGRHGKLEKNDIAYHIEGADVGWDGLVGTHIVIDSKRLREVAKSYNSTVTEFLTAALLHSLQFVHANDRNRRKKDVIKISVPIDLRSFYKVCTLRNFSSYINLGVDLQNKQYSLEGLIKEVEKQKAQGLIKENMEDKIAANVELEENLFVRAIPLFIKRIAIDTICRNHGDKFVTYTLSNIGAMKFPAGMAEHIAEMDCWLGRQRGTSGAATCAACGDKVFLNLSRKIRNDVLEQRVVHLLRELSIPCEVSEVKLA